MVDTETRGIRCVTRVSDGYVDPGHNPVTESSLGKGRTVVPASGWLQISAVLRKPR